MVKAKKASTITSTIKEEKYHIISLFMSRNLISAFYYENISDSTCHRPSLNFSDSTPGGPAVLHNTAGSKSSDSTITKNYLLGN